MAAPSRSPKPRRREAKVRCQYACGAAPGMPQETSGKDAVIAKSQWWVDNHEVHDAVILGPWPNGDEFAVYFKYDVTFKPSGKRFPMEETAMYTVRDGKIVREKFYYRTDG